MGESVRFYEDIDVGDDIEELEICPTTEDVVRYVDVARMQSGRFTDHDYARNEGLPGAIIPGNMSLGFLSRMVTEFFPTGTLRNLTANFHRAPQHTADLQRRCHRETARRGPPPRVLRHCDEQRSR